MNTQLADFQECLRLLRRIVALVGAGILALLGLATFRGLQGLWKNYNMIDLATPDAFYVDPGLVWQFYTWRRHTALQARPNAGHAALAKLSQLKDIEFLTITQNVDGLSTRAGHRSRHLHEIHGLLFELRCTSFTCSYVEKNNVKDPLTPALAEAAEQFRHGDASGKKSGELKNLESTSATSPWSSPGFLPVREIPVDELPKCPVCLALLRPGVVWFGESLPVRALDGIDDFIQQGADLILVVGTSGTVYPANGYVDVVRSRGGSVAIFNTDIEDDVVEGKVPNTWAFKGDAAYWLPRALAPLIGLDEETSGAGPSSRGRE